jgi:hypothetical protein
MFLFVSIEVRNTNPPRGVCSFKYIFHLILLTSDNEQDTLVLMMIFVIIIINYKKVSKK